MENALAAMEVSKNKLIKAALLTFPEARGHCLCFWARLYQHSQLAIKVEFRFHAPLLFRFNF